MVLPSALRTQQPFWPQHLQVHVSQGQTPVSMQHVPSTQQGPHPPTDDAVLVRDGICKTLLPLNVAAPAIAATTPTKATSAKILENFFIVIFPIQMKSKTIEHFRLSKSEARASSNWFQPLAIPGSIESWIEEWGDQQFHRW
jgi:hypothetical protein